MEYEVAMKHIDRICKTYSPECHKCPLSYENNKKNCTCEELITKYPKRTEMILGTWLAENPIRTNREIFVKIIREKFGKDIAEEIKRSLSVSGSGCGYIPCPKHTGCADCKYLGFWDKEYVKPEVNND